MSFNTYAEIAARTCDAEYAIICRRSMTSPALDFLGHYGTFSNFPSEYVVPDFDPTRNGFLVFEDVQNDPRFKGHPLGGLYPKLRNMVMVVLFVDNNDYVVSIGLGNLSMPFVKDDIALAGFMRGLEVIRRLIREEYQDRQRSLKLPPDISQQPGAMAEAILVPPKPDEVEPAAKLLIETLSRRQKLHDRNGTNFVSLREWKKSIKAHQETALAALRRNPSESAVELVAEEIASAVRLIFGKSTICTVAPIFDAAGATENAFLRKLAESVAKHLGAKLKTVFQERGDAGGTKPRAKAGIKLAGEIDGVVLLLADSVEAGERMQEGQRLVRNAGATCFAMAWIGP